jgi:hypothetical protein
MSKRGLAAISSATVAEDFWLEGGSMSRRSPEAASSLPNLVVVPRRPGPLIVPPPPAGAGPRDEVDVGLDDLFGPPFQQKPGPLDAALTIGGIALIAFGSVVKGAGWLIVIGGLSLVLGLAFPIRSLWRRLSRGRSARRLAAILKQGDPLNLSSPATRRLADSYSRLLELAAAGDELSGPDALDASHQALQEVAELLHGRAPQGAAETEYVVRRATAVDGLVRMLEGSDDAADRTEAAARDAAVTAISQFQERAGMSSLDQIEAIRVANRAVGRE